MRVFSAILALALTLISAAAAGSGGIFARNAANIWTHVAGKPGAYRLVSPDHRSVVAAQWHPARDPAGFDDGIMLTTSGAIGRHVIDIGSGVNAEFVWSADSRSFFVTSSDGGSVGEYHLFVVQDGESREVTALVQRAFGHPVRCGEPEPPNVEGIGWLSNGHLLAAAQIMPHSVCDSFGTFATYEIDVARLRIVKKYDQLAAKARFGAMLGSELRAAPDDCIRTPRVCFTSTNHPELHL